MDWVAFDALDKIKLLRTCSSLSLNDINTALDIPDDLLLHRSSGLSVFYAPFGISRPTDAKVAIAGLTPGFSQTIACLRSFQEAQGQMPRFESLLKSKVAFAGPMRANLVRYLDEIGVSDALGLETCHELFAASRSQVATCSLLRYPVFVGEGRKNYNGSSAIRRDSFLRSMIESLFYPFIRSLPVNTLIVPMGKYPSEELAKLALVDPSLSERVLFGFPHTSGGNGHRDKWFRTGRDEFVRKVLLWKRNLS